MSYFTLLPSYDGKSSKSETRNPKQIQNSKRQFSNAEARPLKWLCLFALSMPREKEQKGRARSIVKPTCLVRLEFDVWIIAVCFEFRASDFGFVGGWSYAIRYGPLH